MNFKKITFPNIGFPIIFILIGFLYYFSFNKVYTTTTDSLLNLKIEDSKTQTQLLSKLLAERLKSGYSKKKVKEELQKSIENSASENGFVCMFDIDGKELCHPDLEKIGTVISNNNSTIKSFSNIEITKNFRDALKEQKNFGGLRKMTESENTEIVYLSPVEDTDWVVASHVNLVEFKTIINNLKEKLALIFIIVWLGSSLLIYFFLHKINSINLKEIRKQNKNIEDQYFNELRKLNETFSNKTAKTNHETGRLLANKGNKLVPVEIDNIAFVYTNNKITYLFEHSGNKLTLSLPLDELMKTFNPEIFYRVSRQVITSAKAIEKIERYGNTQLKVFTKPLSPIDIIVGKAKLTEFKQWLGKV